MKKIIMLLLILMPILAFAQAGYIKDWINNLQDAIRMSDGGIVASDSTSSFHYYASLDDKNNVIDWLSFESGRDAIEIVPKHVPIVCFWIETDSDSTTFLESGVSDLVVLRGKDISKFKGLLEEVKGLDQSQRNKIISGYLQLWEEIVSGKTRVDRPSRLTLMRMFAAVLVSASQLKH